MAASISMASNDPVKQFSVFAENRVGRLHDLTALFKEYNVHLMAVTVLDTTDSAIVRVVVDDPDKARELMVNNDFPYTEGEVLAVELTDESELNGVLAALLRPKSTSTTSTASSSARRAAARWRSTPRTPTSRRRR
jgi:hypothetical protein